MRFLQTDPVGYADDLDLYTYVSNDPINDTDPDGTTANSDATCATFLAANSGSEAGCSQWSGGTSNQSSGGTATAGSSQSSSGAANWVQVAANNSDPSARGTLVPLEPLPTQYFVRDEATGQVRPATQAEAAAICAQGCKSERIAGDEFTPAFPIFRGGGSMVARTGVDTRINKATGLLVTDRGISLNSNPAALSRFGGGRRIKSVPPGLALIYTGGTHYELVPAVPMTQGAYQSLLNKVKFQ